MIIKFVSKYSLQTYGMQSANPLASFTVLSEGQKSITLDEAFEAAA